MTKPITPDEVLTKQASKIPPEVIEIFNYLIVNNCYRGEARIGQKDVLTRIAERMDCSTHHVIEQNWLDIEPIFEEVGWKVEYDKADYTEVDGESIFTFTRK